MPASTEVAPTTAMGHLTHTNLLPSGPVGVMQQRGHHPEQHGVPADGQALYNPRSATGNPGGGQFYMPKLGRYEIAEGGMSREDMRNLERRLAQLQSPSKADNRDISRAGPSEQQV